MILRFAENRLVRDCSIRFVLCFGFLASQAACAENPDDRLVEKSLAQFVAGEYLPKYYPGEWEPLCDFTLYDLEGRPAAYAFVFKRVGAEIGGLEDLEGAISESYAKRQELDVKLSTLESSPGSTEAGKAEMAGLRKARKDANKGLYRTKDFATVLTGAWRSAPLIYSCEPGIPPILAEKPGLEERTKVLKAGRALALGRVLFLNPYDIRYEVVSPEQVKILTTARVSGQTVPPADEAFTISWDKKEPEQVSALRAKEMKAQLEKAHQLQMMEESERSRYQEGVEQRKRTNSQKWDDIKAQGSNIGK